MNVDDEHEALIEAPHDLLPGNVGPWRRKRTLSDDPSVGDRTLLGARAGRAVEATERAA